MTSTTQRWRTRATTPNLLGLSFGIQVALLLYANHVDSHPERYGGLKYTDVDWRVVSDGAKLIFGSRQGKRAEGWLVNDTGLPVGESVLPLFSRCSVVEMIVVKNHVAHTL